MLNEKSHVRSAVWIGVALIVNSKPSADASPELIDNPLKPVDPVTGIEIG